MWEDPFYFFCHSVMKFLKPKGFHQSRWSQLFPSSITHRCRICIIYHSSGYHLHSLELIWNWKMTPLKTIFHYKQVVFHFHVSFRESISPHLLRPPLPPLPRSSTESTESAVPRLLEGALAHASKRTGGRQLEKKTSRQSTEAASDKVKVSQRLFSLDGHVELLLFLEVFSVRGASMNPFG